jgi:16S rRNA (uracil1498-N3)-methyltransferase
MADRFYVNQPLGVGQVRLEGADAHHLAAVCRYRAGDQVYLFNGDGSQYLARVENVQRHSIDLDVLSHDSPARELSRALEVAAPVPKGDRAQFLVEKLTELGVTAFVPLRTERSVVHPGQGKLDKLERYVIEASKQCGRNVLLRVEQPANWPDYCRRSRSDIARVVAHPGGSKISPGSTGDTAVAVGPEGGFTDEEIDLAKLAGWHVADLGPRTLRIETAAILLAAWAVRECPMPSDQ